MDHFVEEEDKLSNQHPVDKKKIGNTLQNNQYSISRIQIIDVRFDCGENGKKWRISSVCCIPWYSIEMVDCWSERFEKRYPKSPTASKIAYFIERRKRILVHLVMNRRFVVHYYDYLIVEKEKRVHFDWLLEFQRKIDSLMKKEILRR